MKNAKWHFALLAVVLATISWYLVTGRERVETWIEIPVVMTNVPENMVVRKGMVSRIEARVSGPGGLLNTRTPLNASYVLDLRGVVPGENVIQFSPEDIRLPGPMHVMELNPSKTVLVVDTVELRSVAVSPEYKGTLDRNWLLLEASVEPRTVELRGPKSVIDSVHDISTEPLLLATATPDTVAATLRLDTPAEVEAKPAQVAVRFVFGPRTQEVWVKLPVELPPELKGKVRIEPDSVRLLLNVPVYLLPDEEFRKNIHVRLSANQVMMPGEHEAAYTVELPERTRVVEAKPEKVTVSFAAP